MSLKRRAVQEAWEELMRRVPKVTQSAAPKIRFKPGVEKTAGKGSNISFKQGADAVVDAVGNAAEAVRLPSVGQGYRNAARAIGGLLKSTPGQYVGVTGLVLGGGALATQGIKDVLGPGISSAAGGDSFIISPTQFAEDLIDRGGVTSLNGRDVIDYSLADQVRAAIGIGENRLGPTRADTLKAVQEIEQRRFLEDAIGASLLQTAAGDGFVLDTNVLKRKPGQSLKSFEQQIAPEVDRLKAFKKAKADPNIKVPLTGTESVEDLARMQVDAARALPWSPEKQYLDLKQQQLRLEKERNAQLELQNKQADYDFRASQLRLDYADKTNQANRRQDLQFRLMDREDSRLDRKEREDRANRADRRETIAALMAGLSQLGVSLAV